MLRLLNENDKTEIMDKFSEVDSMISTRQIVVEKSGEVITASDSAEAELAGLSVFGKSTQDGTPTPTAPIEIVSMENPKAMVCGKNLLPIYDEDKIGNGINVTVNNDGSITINGTATERNVLYFMRSDAKMYLSKGTYRISMGTIMPTGVNFVFEYYEDGVWQDVIGRVAEGNSAGTLTIDEPLNVAAYIEIKSGTTVDNITLYPQIEVGTVATEYEPYNEPQSLSVPYTLRGIPVASGGNYTNSDGQQWVCDEVDFERGVLVKRIKRVAVGSLETPVLYNVTQGNLFRFSVYDVKQIKQASEKPCLLCDSYLCTTTSERDNYTISMAVQYSAIDFINNDYTEVEAFKTAMEDVYIDYALTTPIETALTEEELEAYKALHTNKPNTTIFNDAGTGMSVGYVADAKIYIDNKFEEIKALITTE